MPIGIAKTWARLLVLALATMLALAGCGKTKKHEPEHVSEELIGVSQSVSLLHDIRQDGVSLGNPDAPVVLTEFADLQCPYCGAVAVVTLPRIIDRYVRHGKVRLVFRNLAFLGPDSVRAARMAAAAAEQDKMFQFVEIFLHNQGEENSGYVTDDFLRKVASAVPGLDVDRAFHDRDSDAVKNRLEEARNEAEQFNIRATPSFLLGKAGEKPEELQLPTLDPAFLEQKIQELLPEGDASTEGGAAPNE